VVLSLSPTYSLPFVLPFICLIAFITESGLTAQEEQIVSSLYIESGEEQDLQSLVFPLLFCLFECRYLSAIFSFVAKSLHSAEQYI
jgi:hypothetical protein